MKNARQEVQGPVFASPEFQRWLWKEELQEGGIQGTPRNSESDSSGPDAGGAVSLYTTTETGFSNCLSLESLDNYHNQVQQGQVKGQLELPLWTGDGVSVGSGSQVGGVTGKDASTGDQVKGYRGALGYRD